MWSALQHLAHGVRDVVAPARCIGCLTEGTWHCTACSSDQLRPPILSCIVCGKKHHRGLTCTECKSESSLTGSISVVSYHATWARRAIHWLKFKRVRGVANPLALLLSQHLTVIAPLEMLQHQAALLPIPLHLSRLRDRGFNQSEDISKEISRMTGIPTLNALTRTRSTQAQSQLPSTLRKENVQDAFSIAQNIPNTTRFCLIIDDVTTSGATLSAAAQLLPSHVQAWGCTIARG